LRSSREENPNINPRGELSIRKEKKHEVLFINIPDCARTTQFTSDNLPLNAFYLSKNLNTAYDCEKNSLKFEQGRLEM